MTDRYLPPTPDYGELLAAVEKHWREWTRFAQVAYEEQTYGTHSRLSRFTDAQLIAELARRHP